MPEPGDERDLRVRLFGQRIADLEAENATLREQLDRVQQTRTDASFASLVGSLADAAAVSEASTADRAVVSLGLTLQSYLTFENGELGVRFVPPELAANPSGLSTASIELAKVPRLDADPGRNLRLALEEKQQVHATLAARGVAPAARVVAETGSALATTSSWSIESIVATATAIARLERDVAAALSETRRPVEAVTSFRGAVEALTAVVSVLATRPPAAADLPALVAALEETTRAAALLE